MWEINELVLIQGYEIKNGAKIRLAVTPDELVELGILIDKVIGDKKGQA